MSRERITSKDMQADDLEAALATLEKSMTATDKVTAADDKEITSLADKLSKEEKKVVNESAPAGKAELKDVGDQNAKANANWKLTESERTKVARRLVKLATVLLEG